MSLRRTVAASSLKEALYGYRHNGAQPDFVAGWGRVDGCMTLGAHDSDGQRLEAACFLGEGGLMVLLPDAEEEDGPRYFEIAVAPGGVLWGVIFDRSRLRSLPPLPAVVPEALVDRVENSVEELATLGEHAEAGPIIRALCADLKDCDVQAVEHFCTFYTVSFSWMANGVMRKSEVSWLDLGLTYCHAIPEGVSPEVDLLKAHDTSSIWLDIVRSAPRPTDVVEWFATG